MAQSTHANTRPCNTNKRSRSWFMTINNPSTADTEKFKNFQIVGLKKMSAQIEKGKEGTLHIQAYVEFKNARYFSALKKEFPRAHLEKPENNLKCYNYCKKEDTRIEGPWLFPVPVKKVEPKDIIIMRLFDEWCKKTLNRTVPDDLYMDWFNAWREARL